MLLEPESLLPLTLFHVTWGVTFGLLRHADRFFDAGYGSSVTYPEAARAALLLRWPMDRTC